MFGRIIFIFTELPGSCIVSIVITKFTHRWKTTKTINIELIHTLVHSVDTTFENTYFFFFYTSRPRETSESPRLNRIYYKSLSFLIRSVYWTIEIEFSNSKTVV